jgi:hypothetical protein
MTLVMLSSLMVLVVVFGLGCSLEAGFARGKPTGGTRRRRPAHRGKQKAPQQVLQGFAICAWRRRVR